MGKLNNPKSKRFTMDELKFIKNMLSSTYLIDWEMKESIKKKCEHLEYQLIMRLK